MKFITKLAVALAVFGALSFAPRALVKPESVYADAPIYDHWIENTNYYITDDQNERTMTIKDGIYSGGEGVNNNTSYVVEKGTSLLTEPRHDLAYIIQTKRITNVICEGGVVFNNDCSGLFANCTNLTSVDMCNVDMTKVTSVGNLFNHCTSLTSVQLPIMAPTNVAGMFQDCEKLRSVDLSNLNLDKIYEVNDYTNMFLGSYIMFIKAPASDSNRIIASLTTDNSYITGTWKVNSDETEYTKYTAKTYKAAANNIGYCFDTFETDNSSIYAVLKITDSEETLKNKNSIAIKNTSSQQTLYSLYEVYNTIQFPDGSKLNRTEEKGEEFTDCYLVAVKITGVEELPESFGFELK